MRLQVREACVHQIVMSLQLMQYHQVSILKSLQIQECLQGKANLRILNMKIYFLEEII